LWSRSQFPARRKLLRLLTAAFGAEATTGVMPVVDD
jgi:hypothetical protein